MNGAPVRVEMSLPSAGAALAPGSPLGLNLSLSGANAVPTPLAPSVAVAPLSFKTSALPAAVKSVAVDAAGPVVPAALTPNNPIPIPVVEPSVSLEARFDEMRRHFDGSRPHKGGLPVPSAPAAIEYRPGQIILHVKSAALQGEGRLQQKVAAFLKVIGHQMVQDPDPLIDQAERMGLDEISLFLKVPEGSEMAVGGAIQGKYPELVSSYARSLVTARTPMETSREEEGLLFLGAPSNDNAPSASQKIKADKADALSGKTRPVSAPPSNNAPKTPHARVSVGLALAAAGAAAAWYTSAWAVAVLGGLLAPVVAVPALALAAGWIALGALAGFAAFSVETWKGFPTDLKNSSVSAGAMTYRFWARFGLIFDSVLRGSSTDEAMKKELSANILRYPVIAWPFILAGYVMSPIAFALGAAYRVVGTPLLAAFRGAREVIVGFLPWMERVIRFLTRVIEHSFPFIVGFITGALKTAFAGASVGAVLLAGPIARDAFGTTYKPASLPGWVAYRLTQVAALAAIVVTGALGTAIGLLVSPVHVMMGALLNAFAWSGVNDAGATFFKRWVLAVKNDGAFSVLIERGFPLAKDNLSLAARTTRALNGTAISLYTALWLPLVSIGTIVRATSAALHGVDVKRADTPSRSTGETGTEPAVTPRPGFVAPTMLGLIGAGAGVLAYGVLGGLAGAGLGLALSQPQVLSGWLSDVISEGGLSTKQSFEGWIDANQRIYAAMLRGDATLRESESLYILTIFAAPLSGLIGGLLGAAAKPGAAAWTGFMAVVTQFVPFLKRFFNWAVKVLKNIVPFVPGFIFGTLLGALKSGFFVATNLFRPMGEIFKREDALRSRPSGAQVSAGVLMALTLVVPALAVFVGSFVVGVIAGIPVALTHGLSLGVRWAGTGEASEKYFRTWDRRSLPNALSQARDVVTIKLGSEGAELPIWRLYVRTVSFLLAAIPSTIALVVAGGVAYLRSLADARLAKSKPEAERASSYEAPAAPAPKTEQAPVGKPPVWLAATLGALGLAAGVYAAVALGLPLISPLAALAGLSAGLAVSQPLLWTRLLPSAVDHSQAGFSLSLDYWTAAGKAVRLEPVYRAIGGTLGLAWAQAGAAFAVASVGASAAYAGARQVVYEMLPFLRTAFETAMKVLRRIVPFVFGFLAGLVSGIIGSAAFGALILGRPYFKHVVADDFKYSGALGFLGNAFLKLVAFVLGVAFGLVGVAAGVLVAAPYALTSSVALAFRFADIGGPAQRYLDHWTYGALRAEMQRLNQLTDRFQFPEGEAAISDGWIRMANILPATIVAAFAATIPGWVGYVRSLVVAYRSAKSGGPIPSPIVDQDASRHWDRTWRSAKKTAASFFAWGIAGAVIGLGVMLMTSWAPLGLAGWLLVGALAATGVLGAFALAGIIAALALIFWINGQLR